MEIIIKAWLYWMPFAFLILVVSEKEKYNPFNKRPEWWALVVVTIIWPIYYLIAFFDKRRG